MGRVKNPKVTERNQKLLHAWKHETWHDGNIQKLAKGMCVSPKNAYKILRLAGCTDVSDRQPLKRQDFSRPISNKHVAIGRMILKKSAEIKLDKGFNSTEEKFFLQTELRCVSTIELNRILRGCLDLTITQLERIAGFLGMSDETQLLIEARRYCQTYEKLSEITGSCPGSFTGSPNIKK